MKIRHLMVSLALLLAVATSVQAMTPAAKMTTCNGKFPNPITDVCWSCMFPLTLGGATLSSEGQDIPADNGDAICVCPAPPPLFKRAGASLGYWEPVRSVDVGRKPFCLVGLGGIDAGGDASSSEESSAGETAGEEGGSLLPMAEHGRSTDDHHGGSFYQAHWYANPLMYLLEAVVDSNCMESGSMDVEYMTEVDPTWSDDEMTNILNFEAALFTNPIVQASCVVDCLAATTILPVPFMFWCSGCNGGTFPLNGHVQAHVGGIQAASLVAERLALKLQRMNINWTHHTSAAVCGPFPNPILDKMAFKQMIQYPIPQTDKKSSLQGCCNWMGGLTVIPGIGKEYPYKGEDFSFFMFRKRVCCMY